MEGLQPEAVSSFGFVAVGASLMLSAASDRRRPQENPSPDEGTQAEAAAPGRENGGAERCSSLLDHDRSTSYS